MVRSARRIPGLEPLPSTPRVDLEIELGAGHPDTPATSSSDTLLYRSSQRDALQDAVLEVRRSAADGYVFFDYADGTRFTLDAAGRRIWGTWRHPYTLADAATYLLGPVVGFALRLRGGVALHASAVSVEGGAIALMAAGGWGKSTAAAAFVRRGHRALSDDLLPIVDRDRGFWAQPSFPRLRLWPDSAAAVFGTAEHLPPLTPNWDKLAFDLGTSFEAEPRPLAAIYLLTASPGGRPQITPLVGRRAVVALVSHSYVNYLLDTGMRARELELFGRLVESVPLRALCLPEHPLAPAALCELVLDDLDRLAPSRRRPVAVGELGA